MNGLTIQPNGQTLVVTAGPANFYSDTGLSAAVTYPVTVSATTPWYCSAAVAAAVPDVSLTITQPDGSTIYSGSIRVGQTTDTFVRPQPTGHQVAEDVARVDAKTLTTGEATIPRSVLGATPAVATGDMHLTFFRSVKTEPTTNVTLWTSGTAAAATPTLVRVGIYSVDSPGNLTLEGSTATDTSLFGSTYTKYTKALSAPFTRTAGRQYALGVLVVSAGACPSFVGAPHLGVTIVANILNTSPRRTAYLGSNADLPATVAFDDGNLSVSAVMLYAELT